MSKYQQKSLFNRYNLIPLLFWITLLWLGWENIHNPTQYSTSHLVSNLLSQKKLNAQQNQWEIQQLEVLQIPEHEKVQKK